MSSASYDLNMGAAGPMRRSHQRGSVRSTQRKAGPAGDRHAEVYWYHCRLTTPD